MTTPRSDTEPEEGMLIGALRVGGWGGVFRPLEVLEVPSHFDNLQRFCKSGMICFRTARMNEHIAM
jgi:hypothetical protein